MAAYRTDEKKSADAALLIGALSVTRRRHVCGSRSTSAGAAG
jgi:NAD(P)-dependent dehydrogenase (short-subunit alcohol dehydrogenase family)